MNSKIKIESLENHGHAEPLRMILKYFDIDFENKYLTNEEWKELQEDKLLYPFGTLPVIVLGDKRKH